MPGHYHPIGSFSVLVLALLTASGLRGQTFIMADGASWNTCSGNFFDSGNAGGDYNSDEDLTATFCPGGGAGSGVAITVHFFAFQAEVIDDYLVIHDGTSTADPVLATGDSNNPLTGQSFTATGPSGCLTFHWLSDVGLNAAGWEAEVSTCDAGTDASLTVCSNGSAFDLIDVLGGDPDPGGTWSGPGGPHGPQYDPATDTSGDYTYIVGDGNACADTATVTITNELAPDAGSDGTLPLCSSSAPADLINSLSGSPMNGGTWTGPGGPHDGSYDPATDPPGGYIYTVAGVPPCQDASATVTVVLSDPDAGSNASMTVCSDQAAFPLIDGSGGSPDPGGVWTGPGGPHGAQYDPGSEPGGDYTYTVTAGTCTASATLSITNVTAPDAGTDGSLQICQSSSPVDLINSLGGTPDVGGSWSGPGGAHDGSFDPASDAPGNYIYTVSASPPCTNATATVTVTISGPDAGNNATLTVCTDDPPFALIGALGGSPDTGGTWTGPGGSHGPQYDPGSEAGGVYTYTVTAGSCTASATLTITTVAAADAGTNGSLQICATSAPVNLINSLGGTPDGGGSWSGPGGPHDGSFDPASDAPGNYTYTVNGSPPCTNATATVTVTISGPDAGNNATLAVCTDNAPFALLTALGGSPDAGGTWSGPGGPHGPQYDPGTEAGGVYTYTVTAGTCTASATLTITIVQAADAGNNGTLQICESSAPVNLINSLGGTPDGGGNWSGPGGPHDGSFDPASNAPGVYTYTVSGAPPCANATATVTVTISGPDAGNNASLSVCSSGSPFPLIDGLGGSPDTGGSWSGPGGSHGPQYDPASDPGGVYTYTVNAGSCTASATLTITNVPAPDAGSSGTVQICESSSPINLFNNLGGTPDAGGTWNGPNGPHDGSFDPATDQAGSYIYLVLGTTPCANATATITVVITAPDAGTNASLTICSSTSAFQLLDVLGGDPDLGGSWTGPGGPHGSQYDPGTEPGGVYTYTVTAGSCVSSAAVTITNVPGPDAGDDGTLLICETSTPVNLINSLGGTPDVGGAWTGPNGPHDGSYDPATDPAGDYTYSIPGTLPCSNASATVTVVITGPNAGNSTSVTVCSTQGPLSLFNALGGTPNVGGTWSGPNGPHGAQYDPGTEPGGVYTYTVTAGSCVASATITITNVTGPDAGINGTLQICETSTPVDLINSLGGTPNGGGTWAGPNGPHDGSYDPATDPPGTYLYTVTGNAPCANASASVTVVIAAPNAGTGADISVCSGQQAFPLVDVLAGDPDPGGTWAGPDGTHGPLFDPGYETGGMYTYTVNAGSCVATATLTITILAGPDAGDNDTLTICGQGAPVNLIDSLGGSPENGGTWSSPAGAHDGIFDPTTDLPGIYTYTVTGTGPCPNATATLLVVIAGPDAGFSSSLTVCSGQDPFSLFAVLDGSPDVGGTWTGPGGAHGPLYDPGTDPGGVYTYTVVDASFCTDLATVTIVNVPGPDAGEDGMLIICDVSPPVDLMNELGGVPDAGGTWTGPDGPSEGSYDPATDPPGAYTYTVLGSAPCPFSSATVTVILTGPPEAGTDGQLFVCDTVSVLNLFIGLGGSPDLGGTWQDLDASGALNEGMLNTIGLPPGQYRFLYTVAVTGCGTDEALVQVQVNGRVEVFDLARTCNEALGTSVITFTITGGDPATYTVLGLGGTLEPVEPYRFTSDALPDSVAFTIVVSDQYACGTVQLLMAPCSYVAHVFIPQIFSPNGDGVNDTFQIPGLEDFPGNELHIYNRWGAEVFSAKDYHLKEGWDGSAAQNAFGNGDLPVGTYYYVLDLGSASKVERGFVYLNR